MGLIETVDRVIDRMQKDRERYRKALEGEEAALRREAALGLNNSRF